MGVLSFGVGDRLVRQAAYVRAAAIEVAILTGHVFLYPTGIFQERGPQPPAGDSEEPPRLPTAGRSHPPVLLLHGFVDNRSVFAMLRRSLRRHGWPHVQAL